MRESPLFEMPYPSAAESLESPLPLEAASPLSNDDDAGGLKISDILFEKPRREFGSLAIVASNVQASEAVRLFTLGHHQFAALVGPSGWGKTHLLEAAAVNCAFQPQPRVVAAADWAKQGARGEGPGPLILDNVQDAAVLARLRQPLRIGLERRVRSGRQTLLSITSTMPARLVKALLPSAKDWVIAHIDAPTSNERVLIIEKTAAVNDVALSSEIVQIMARRLGGNGRTLEGAVKRLKLDGSDWSSPELALRACGLLDPYFSANSGWDLREAIARVAHENRGIVPKNRIKDLCLYLMLHRAQLNEASAAQFFNIEPCDAFQRAARFAKTIDQVEWELSAVSRITRETVAFLLQE